MNHDALTAESVMPFGIHKGKQLKKVPATYLLWLRINMVPTNPMQEQLMAFLTKRFPEREWARP